MFNEKFVLENIRYSINVLRSRIYTKVCDLQIEAYHSKEPLPFARRKNGERRELTAGEKWGDLFDCAWFHCTATLPDSVVGEKIVFVMDINGEGLVFDDDGCPLRGITNINSEFDRAMGNPGKRIVQFKESANGGEKVDFWMDAGCNDLFGNLRENGTLKEAYAAVCDDSARKLFYDMTVLYVQAENTLENDPIRYELTELLSRCHYLLKNYTADEIAECSALTGDRLALKGGDSPALSLTAFGHAHIDLAWLWPIRETKRKGARTFATALELMSRYDEYLFGATQPQLYDWVKQDYPLLYDKIKTAYQKGRWELLGAVWTEPDTNCISGESMIRQILYGNAFWKKEFGQTVDFIFMPDTFGYSAALPQILKKSGIHYFATIKMSWNQINDFPYTNFKWRGIDGSEVLVHMPPEGNYLSEGTAKSVLKIKKRLSQNGQFGEALLPFGIGDGGGGPSPSHLEYLRREENLPGLCPIKQGKMADFFTRLNTRADSLPVWDDEMYLERHLGVYTSAARNKKYNRLLELTLRDAEILSAFAMSAADGSYPAADFERIWKEVLLYQFHDILPGSSIQRVYDECLERYAALYEQAQALKMSAAEEIAKKADTSGFKNPVVVFNTLSFTREMVVETERGSAKVSLPQMGYKVIDTDELTYSVSRMESLENEYLKVEINADGSLKSVYQKELGKELLQGDSNILYLYDDIENAWNLQYDYQNQRPERAEFVSGRFEATPNGGKIT